MDECLEEQFADPVFPEQFVIQPGEPTLEDVEMSYILYVLRRHKGNKPAAAKQLGIALKTLYNKLNRLELAKS